MMQDDVIITRSQTNDCELYDCTRRRFREKYIVSLTARDGAGIILCQLINIMYKQKKIRGKQLR